MAVGSHAQQHHAERRGGGDAGLGLQRGLLVADAREEQRRKAGLGRLAGQQVATHQALVAAGIGRRHPALVG